MNPKKILSLYKKEMKETLRDKKTLVSMIVIPLLLYPLLFSLFSQFTSAAISKIDKEKSMVALANSIPDSLRNSINRDEKIEILESSNYKEDLDTKRIDAYIDYQVQASKENIIVSYDRTKDKSVHAKNRLKEIFNTYKREVQEKELKQAGVDISVLDAVLFTEENVATSSRMGSSLLGSIIPILLVTSIFLGAFFPAIDATAGEKERGTIETILTAPIEKAELFYGKFLTVSTVAIITGVLNLVSMMMVYSLGFVQLSMIAGEKMSFMMSPETFFIAFLLIISLAFFISTTSLLVCIFARSFKDAQNYITPVMFLFIFPAYAPMIPGVELNTVLSLIPVLNISLVIEQIFMQNIHFNHIFMALVSNSLCALVGAYFFSKVFDSEKVLFAESMKFSFKFNRNLIKKRETLAPSDAVFVFAVSIFLLIYIGSIIQLKFKIYGLFATELLLILLPVLIAVWYFNADVKKSLNFRTFNPAAVIGAVIMWIGTFIIVVYISQYLSAFFPEAENFGKEFNNLVTGSGIWMAVLAISVAPAVCEELLFRGIILSALKKYKFGIITTTIITSVMFGVFHLQLFRLFPIFLLGLLLTYVVYKTGSIFVSMILHFLNNLIAVLMSFYPEIVNMFPINALNQPTFEIVLIIAGGIFIFLGRLIIIKLPNGVTVKGAAVHS